MPDGYRTGYVSGIIIVGGLLFLGAVWSYFAARKPGLNRKCVLAQAAALLLWSFGALSELVFGLSDNPERWFPLLFAVRVGLGIWTVVLAVQGLIERRRATPRPRGMTHAIGAMIVAALVVGVPVLRSVTGRDPVVPSDVRPVSKPAPRGGRLEFADLNFAFDVPAAPWTQVDAKAINPVSCLAFLRSNPQVFFIVIAEATGNPEFGTEGILAVARGNLMSASPASRLSDESPEIVNGIEGTVFRSEGSIGGNAFRLAFWVHAKNGYCYQLVAWAARSVSEAALVEMARELRAGFHVIDPDRRSTSAPPPLPPVHSSDTYGYSVDLSGPNWDPWPDIGTKFEEAHFGVVNRDDTSAFAVVPVRLFGRTPDLETLAGALLSTMDFSYPSSSIGAASPLSHGAIEGLRIESERVLQQVPHRYVFHVLRREDVAYLFVAWHREGSESGRADAERILGSVAIGEPAPSPAGVDGFDARERARLAFVFEALAAFVEKRDRAAATDYLRMALDLEPASRARMIRLLDSFLAERAYEQALSCLDASGGPFESDLEVLSYRPYALSRIGRDALAIEAYAPLFDAGYRGEIDLGEFAELLWSAGRTDEAFARVRSHLEAGDSKRVRLLLASFHRRSGDPESAIQVLLDQLARTPDDEDAMSDLIAIYRDEGRDAESLDLCESAILRRGPGAFLLFEKGKAQYRLGWYREAKASLEAALDRSPANEEIRDFLDHVTGIVGEGSNRLVRDAIEPVAIPAEMLEDGPEPEGDPTDWGGYVVRRITAVSFVEGKELRATDHRHVKVVTKEGASRFGSFEFTFDPLTEAVFVNSLIVRSASGEVAYTGRIEDMYVVDSETGETASQEKRLVVPVRGVSPGSTIDLTVTRRDFAAPRRLRFLRYALWTSVPTGRVAVFLSGDVEQAAHVAGNGVAARSSSGGLAFSVDRPPLYVSEPLQPPAEEYLPFVCLSDRRESWQEVATAYLETIADRLLPDAAAAEVARSVAGEIPGESEKALALARYVRDGIAYKAIEFGRRAFVPNRAADVLGARFGDCKDHSVLLLQLLRSAGLRADLALVDTSSALQESLPSIDQFDHMIVWCPSIGGGRFLDTTDRTMSLFAAAPHGLGGRKTLVLDGGRARVVPIPSYEPDSSVVRIERTAEVEADGSVVVRETVTLSGYFACNMRQALTEAPPDERVSVLQSRMQSGGGSPRLDELETKDLTLPDEPLVLSLRYRLDRAVHSDGDRIVGRLPAIWERYYLAPQPMNSRATPFAIRYPMTLESRATLRSPPGFEFVAEMDVSPRSSPASGGSNIAWESTVTRNSAELAARSVVRESDGAFSAADYARYQKDASEALSAIEREIALVRPAR